MTSVVTITLPDGRSWIPRFVRNIDQEKCIGCGRCFRVCGRELQHLAGINDEGELIPFNGLDAEDDDAEYEKKIMTIANPKNCIGCEACSKICPKKCYTHEAMTA